MGIPMPGRRSKTDQNKKPTISLSGKISKQDGVKSTVTLDSDDGRNIELKVTGDTKITGDSGKLNAADLHTGDEISVQAHTDDKGFFYADTIQLDKSAAVNNSSDAKPTATDPDDHRPVLKRASSSSEQTAPDSKTSDSKPASDDPDRPILKRADSSPSTSAKADATPAAKPTVKKDDEYETGEEHPILPPGGSTPSASASNDPDRPVLRRGAPQPRSSSSDSDTDRPVQMAKTSAPANLPPSKNDEPEIHTDPDAPAQVHYVTGSGDDFIQKAREATFEFDQKLPNFVCQQMVARYQSETQKPSWQAHVDVLSYDLVYEDGKENYKNPKINGKSVKAGADKESGSWSSGEFGTLVIDIFHPTTAADFRPKGQETIKTIGPPKVYTFSVDKDHSHWRIQGGTQWILPAYKGTIWIDKETYRALRIEMEAVNMPQAFILDHTESAADYDFVTIKDQKILLPTHAEVLSCERGSYLCSRNAIDFRNYHAYAGFSLRLPSGNQQGPSVASHCWHDCCAGLPEVFCGSCNATRFPSSSAVPSFRLAWRRSLSWWSRPAIGAASFLSRSVRMEPCWHRAARPTAPSDSGKARPGASCEFCWDTNTTLLGSRSAPTVGCWLPRAPTAPSSCGTFSTGVSCAL